MWVHHKKPPPHDKLDWVEIHVHIERVSDQVVRTLKTTGLLENGTDKLATFIWRDGNFACDCNRDHFFGEVIGEPYAEAECGHSRYVVWIVNPATGEVVYDERTEKNPS